MMIIKATNTRLEEIPVGSEGDFTLNLVTEQQGWKIYVADQAYVEPFEPSGNPEDYVRIYYGKELHPLRALINRMNELENASSRCTEDDEYTTEMLLDVGRAMSRELETLIGEEHPETYDETIPVLLSFNFSQEEAEVVADHLVATLQID